MRRRDVIALFGGGAALWPLAARGQQPIATLPVVTLINARSVGAASLIAAEFRKGLSQAGLTEGKDVAVVIFQMASQSHENVCAIHDSSSADTGRINSDTPCCDIPGCCDRPFRVRDNIP